MAELRWVARRFPPVQARFDGPAIAPTADGGGRVCEPIAQQRLHSGMGDRAAQPDREPVAPGPRDTGADAEAAAAGIG